MTNGYGYGRESEPYRVPVADADRIRAEAALHLAALAFGVPADEMLGLRGQVRLRASRARWSAMYLAHIAFGWQLERVAHAFGLNRATAATGCRWVEDEREKRDFDKVIEGLDACLRSVMELPAPSMSLPPRAGDRK
ncbi:chromosomal replication initiator DnaA [Brevundimonas faecalis]|uniref:chromosomal replication initiator DnaA n=1 Tax=Brevundimonas faecalis TaxID=947378 RepID=UPI00361759CE